MNTLGIIDYGAGNRSSVCNSFLAAGYASVLVRSAEDMAGVTHLVLPGVGAFGDCSAALSRQGLTEPLRAWIGADKPFLGICIGYQILFDSSEETPDAPGLGIFRGQVRRFPSAGLKVPHMGWNNISVTDAADPLWEGMAPEPYFYFVHSYYPEPADSSIIAASCTYGVRFAAAIRRGNLAATQFHPEKSQVAGLMMLRNFMNLAAPPHA